MKKKNVLSAAIAFFVLTGISAFAENPLSPEISSRVVKQGEVFLMRAAGSRSLKFIEGEFQGKRAPLAMNPSGKFYEGLLGVDLDTKPAKYRIKIFGKDGERKILLGISSLEVKKTVFQSQALSLPSSMVDLDPGTLERVKDENNRLEDLFLRVRREKLWQGSFVRPVQGEISTPFGVRRVINGQKKSPHSGIDLRAGEGTPVAASNAGSVAIVADLFFSGKSVVLDHGQGIYSMYFHLSEILAREGERIGKGEVLGRVGSTGRSTGPHLHWGFRVHGSRVDPFSLLRVTEPLRD